MNYEDLMKSMRWIYPRDDDLLKDELPGANLAIGHAGDWSVVNCGQGLLSGLQCCQALDGEDPPDGFDKIWDELLGCVGLSDELIATFSAGGHSCHESIYLNVWSRKTGARVGHFVWPESTPEKMKWWPDDSRCFLMGYQELVDLLVGLGL